jgi:hypothetical protein
MEMHYPPVVGDPPAHPVVVILALLFTVPEGREITGVGREY